MKSTNPATGELLAEFDTHVAAEIDSRLNAAVSAQAEWARTPLSARCELLTRMASALRKDKARFAGLITAEMGKTLREAEGEIEKCAICCDHYAAEAASYLEPQTIASNATESAVVFDPLGVVLAVMPWNYPFWQFIRFAAPALAAGNAAMLKHASNVPQCALALQEVATAAGAPDGLVTTLLVGSGEVAGLLADPRIAAVTLTGSTGAGEKVAAEAGKNLKKQVLELGGSDPFIVLADADIEAAAKTAVRGRFQNSGQSCIAAKRFIVVDSVAEAFTDAVLAAASALKVGDPCDPTTDMGPMASVALRDELHEQVEATVKDGATLRMGGVKPDGPGAFYPVTVLDNVTSEMTGFREETFGPAAAIIRARDTDDAIALANDCEFGLGAALWTSDLAAARDLARRIEAGAVFVNGMVASDSRLPFGGIKRSGYGRELGPYGIREFTNVKTVWIGPAIE